jgi:hypothetical protein
MTKDELKVLVAPARIGVETDYEFKLRNALSVACVRHGADAYQIVNALGIFVSDSKIRMWLVENNPEALEQALRAIGVST